MTKPTSFMDGERARAVAWKHSTNTLPGAAKAPAAYIQQTGEPTVALYDHCLPAEWARLSLLPEVRDVALQLFAELEIPWHAGIECGPSNHLLSSQVQCVNALAQMVSDPSRVVAAFAGPLGTVEVVPIEPGRYLTFEYIGPTDFFGEAPHGTRTRGAHCTSVDAAFLHRLADGITELVLLEWKFTESYWPRTPQPKKDAIRRKRYGPSYADLAGPLRSELLDIDHLLAEPLYQLMRQQLLAWRLRRRWLRSGPGRSRLPIGEHRLPVVPARSSTHRSRVERQRDLVPPLTYARALLLPRPVGVPRFHDHVGRVRIPIRRPACGARMSAGPTDVTTRLGAVELDRVAGALVGLAAGDALGAGYEFGPPAPAEPQMIGGGLGGWEPGEWTDDTQMALCIGQVTAAGTLDPESVAARFLDWYRSGPADVGVQTRGVLGAATGPSDVSVRSAAYLTAHPDRSAGNGSLMRTAPVALAHLGDDAAIATSARRMSDLTHGDPVAGDACVLWCIAIDRAIRQGRLDGIHDAIQFLNTDRQTFWTDRILEAEQQPPSTFNPNGYVVDALRAAYSAVIQTPIPNQLPCLHLQHALATAVRIGNDTDTVAAIAGSLLGARWGASAVPARCKTLLHGWPGLTTPDLIRLAVMSARSGQPDSTGWPAADTLRPYYDQHFPTQPVDVALADDPGVRIGNFAALSTLADQPPDVVVSLCRIGPDDIPPGSSSYQVWLMDEPNTEQNPNLDFLLTDLGEQICAWRDAGRSVFIHCVMAESRTPTVAAAYLARRRSLSGAQAIDRVRSLLPSSRPNPGFLAALDKMWPAL